MPKALITGVTGQDGSYLAELLLAKGYQVVGMVRRTSHHSYERIEHLLDRIEIVAADLLDQHSLTVVLQDTRPDEVYNLAAQSYVPTSWTQPVLTGEFTALGVTRILEAIRLVASRRPLLPGQLLGDVRQGDARRRRRETTPFYPRSPYGVAKVYGHWITVNYRESYGLYAVSGILFNHESPRRGHRVRHAARSPTASARIKLGLAKELRLGNLDAQRDWGFAGDYVEAMWRMLQQPDAPGLRHRHRRDPQRARAGGAGLRPRRARLAQASWCSDPQVLPSGRGGPAAGRSRQGAPRARLDAEGRLRRSWWR